MYVRISVFLVSESVSLCFMGFTWLQTKFPVGGNKGEVEVEGLMTKFSGEAATKTLFFLSVYDFVFCFFVALLWSLTWELRWVLGCYRGRWRKWWWRGRKGRLAYGGRSCHTFLPERSPLHPKTHYLPRSYTQSRPKNTQTRCNKWHTEPFIRILILLSKKNIILKYFLFSNKVKG